MTDHELPLLVPAACRKFLAATQHNFLNPPFRSSAFGGIAADGNRVSRLDRTLCPAGPAQPIGAGEFPLPLLVFSGFILAVQENQNMGIDKLEVGDGALDGDRFRRIVVRRAVMR